MARERIDTVPPVEDMLLGTTIGDRYAVERIIGRGGMGVVYAGRHEELQRPIAIKVLMPVWSTQPEAIGRFFQEARTASSVGHPNIVDVYDLGRLPDERPYLVMPLLDGVTLSEYLEEHGPQKEERVVELLSGVAGALDLMHTKGMVHRDIKPDNMMLVRREDGEETVKLLDFGLAALMQSTSRMTQQGSIFGTPHYMSPEAATGEMPDSRGDIYSLATVAFELLTGELPFDAEHPMRILTLKLNQDAVRLNDVSKRVFSTDVEKVIAKSLALEPEWRHETCREFIDELRNACDGSNVRPARGTERLPLPQPATYRASGRQPARVPKKPEANIDAAMSLPTRSRRPLLIVAALLLLGVGGATLWAGQPSEEADASDLASVDQPSTLPEPSPLAELEQEADEVPEIEDVAMVESVVVPPPPSMRIRRGMTSAMMTIVSEMEIATPAAMNANPELTPERAPSADPERAARLTREGTTAFAQGRLPAAVNLFREATQVAPAYSAAWRGLGLANERFGRQREARRAYGRYLRLAPRAADAAAIRQRMSSLGD